MNLIFLSADHARIHGGLSAACAAAALGRDVRLFFQGVAVAGLAQRDWQEDAAHIAIGAPSLADLLAQCTELNVAMMACETGLHLTGTAADDLPDGVETGGLVAFLSVCGSNPVTFV